MKDPLIGPHTLAQWHATCLSDNDQYMSGQISENEYWARVHERDAIVAALRPEDRAKVNDV